MGGLFLILRSKGSPKRLHTLVKVEIRLQLHFGNWMKKGIGEANNILCFSHDHKCKQASIIIIIASGKNWRNHIIMYNDLEGIRREHV